MNIFHQTIMITTGRKILSLGHFEWKASKAMNMKSWHILQMTWL